MYAIHIRDNKLVWDEAQAPVLQAGEILIDNRATAVNRADLVQRSGAYAPPPGASEILGLECAGIVKQVGTGVISHKVGDAVCALLSGGGYASEVVVPAAQALPVPKGFDWVQAAALPEVFATAWLNLFMEAGLQSGERVLVHAGGSGVGTAAVQLCNAFDAPVFVTVGSAEKLEKCLQLGASAGANRHTENFWQDVLKWSGRDGLDVILDPVGAAYLQDNLACLGLDGRLVIIGLMGGAKATLPIGGLMMKRQRIIGSTLRARSVAAKASIMDQLSRHLWPLLEAKRIVPIIHAVMPVTEAEKAQQLMSENDTFGKLVLTIPE